MTDDLEAEIYNLPKLEEELKTIQRQAREAREEEI